MRVPIAHYEIGTRSDVLSFRLRAHTRLYVMATRQAADAVTATQRNSTPARRRATAAVHTTGVARAHLHDCPRICGYVRGYQARGLDILLEKAAGPTGHPGAWIRTAVVREQLFAIMQIAHCVQGNSVSFCVVSQSSWR